MSRILKSGQRSAERIKHSAVVRIRFGPEEECVLVVQICGHDQLNLEYIQWTSLLFSSYFYKQEEIRT